MRGARAMLGARGDEGLGSAGLFAGPAEVHGTAAQPCGITGRFGFPGIWGSAVQ